MGARALVSLTDGAGGAELWAMAVAEEPPVSGEAQGCPGCPLRRGGEWEAGLSAALADAPGLRRHMHRWGCHLPGYRPCAGARRMAKAGDRGCTLVELCAGTAAVSLWALARLRPITGYMGSKRSDAAHLCTVLDCRDPDEVVLVDGGPWGDVWTTVRDGALRAQVVALLRAWDTKGDLPTVWPTLLTPPSADPAQRAAQYLCLQSRAAGCIPVWWSETAGRWESPSGARITTEEAHQRGLCDLKRRGKQGSGRAYPASVPGAGGRKEGPLHSSRASRGLVRIATLADRVESLGRIDWGRVTVHHADVRDIAPIPGATVYMDPPYHGAPRYACLFPRADVLEVALRWARVAGTVVVSEAEPLPLAGWAHQRLRPAGKPEWLTTWGGITRTGEQLDFEATL